MRDYYIVYKAKNKTLDGMGCTIMKIEAPTSIIDIQKIEDAIKTYYGLDDVLIINWKAL